LISTVATCWDWPGGAAATLALGGKAGAQTTALATTADQAGEQRTHQPVGVPVVFQQNAG
jgi:hypothetical protein